MSGSCGSSSTSVVLLELIKAGAAPLAIINSSIDTIVALGSIAADEMYGQSIPVIVLSPEDFRELQSGDYLIIGPDGTVKRKRHSVERQDSEK